MSRINVAFKVKKEVMAFPNKSTNDACLQACIKSVLRFYFPSRIFSDSEIDLHTQYHENHFSWAPASVLWLDLLGLDAKLYMPSVFDFRKFAYYGLTYFRKIKPRENFDMEIKRGDYAFISEIKKSTKLLIKSGLLVNRTLSVDELEKILENEKSLVIGKTMHEWLSGIHTKTGTNHYVVINEKCSPGKWLIEDPGPPLISDREVNQTIQGDPMFPAEIIVIQGEK